jgi:hypothetical protein
MLRAARTSFSGSPLLHGPVFGVKGGAADGGFGHCGLIDLNYTVLSSNNFFIKTCMSLLLIDKKTFNKFFSRLLA